MICFQNFGVPNLAFLNMQLGPDSNVHLAEGSMGQLFVEEQIISGCISETLSRKPCSENRFFLFCRSQRKWNFLIYSNLENAIIQILDTL